MAAFIQVEKGLVLPRKRYCGFMQNATGYQQGPVQQSRPDRAPLVLGPQDPVGWSASGTTQLTFLLLAQFSRSNLRTCVCLTLTQMAWIGLFPLTPIPQAGIEFVLAWLNLFEGPNPGRFTDWATTAAAKLLIYLSTYKKMFNAHIFCRQIGLHDDALVWLVLRVVELVVDARLELNQLHLLTIVPVTSPASGSPHKEAPPLNIPRWDVRAVWFLPNSANFKLGWPLQSIICVTRESPVWRSSALFSRPGQSGTLIRLGPEHRI